MNRVVGRNIYIVDLASVVNSAGGPSAFAQQCQSCGFNAVWARLGYAQDLDDNFDPTKNVALPQILTELADAKVQLWGWHVSHCPPATGQCQPANANAIAEANLVIQCASDHHLAGVLVAAEEDGAGA